MLSVLMNRLFWKKAMLIKALELRLIYAKNKPNPIIARIIKIQLKLVMYSIILVAVAAMIIKPTMSTELFFDSSFGIYFTKNGRSNSDNIGTKNKIVQSRYVEINPPVTEPITRDNE